MNAENPGAHRRGSTWTWTVCGLLMLASAINYMDRQTLAGASVRITREFGLNNAQYGNVEAVFGYAFAAGSLVFGWMADRYPVRWLYAAVLALWSVAGFLTGFATDGVQLLWCRALLGFFEAGHWPCAIRTTRMLLDDRRRSMGNGLLQSGASLGAIVTPLALKALMVSGDGGWRRPFWIVGVVGLSWLIPWLWLVRNEDLRAPSPRVEGGARLIDVLLSRRMWVLFGVLACINTTWQVLRAWLPKFLQQGRGYAESVALDFNAAWFAAADVGCIAAGAAAVWLAGRGMRVHGARTTVFAVCTVLCGAGMLIPWMNAGAALLVLLALMAAGALGVFPLYHAFTQELPASHQGRITGIAGVVGWIAPAQAQQAFGWLADRTKSYDVGLALAGMLPCLALLLIALFWEDPQKNDPPAKTLS